jgi:RNA polymerase sigma-70 factor (ECF subfamily)
MLNLKQRHITENSFKCLFDNYKNRVYGYVLAISHSPYIAEEITQEIFIKLWLCRDILDQVENLEAYIFSIARNKTLNHLRKAAHNIKLLHELEGRMVTANNNIDEKTLSSEYDKLVQEALISLSPQRRLVYQLSRQQGLNHEEIATHLQISRNTVKNHMVEALRFIRIYLGKHELTAALLVIFLSL